MFMAIDGIDGSGKTSAAEGVATVLRESGRVVTVREHPSPGPWGRRCSKMLLKTGTIHRVAAAILLMMDMLPASLLARRARRHDEDIIVVRYGLSCFYLGGRKARFLYRLFTAFMPRPDLNIMVDTKPDVALRRILDRGEEIEVFENRRSMEDARSGMLSAGDVVVVDGNGSVEDTVRGILDSSGRF